MINKKKQNETDTAIVAQENNTVAVRVANVVTGPLDDNFVANGNFAPAQELNLAAEFSGKVISVLVKRRSVAKRTNLSCYKRRYGKCRSPNS